MKHELSATCSVWRSSVLLILDLPFIKIRQSHNSLIFFKGISIPGKMIFTLKQALHIIVCTKTAIISSRYISLCCHALKTCFSDPRCTYLLTHCGLVTLYGSMVFVNVGSDNVLVSSGIKPLPESMLTHHQLIWLIINKISFKIQALSSWNYIWECYL